MTSSEPAFVILSQPSDYELLKNSDIKKDLEHGTINRKADALANLIFSLSNGEKITNDLLMFVIRFLIPLQDKGIKKLLLLFWELIPKYTEDGRLISEMILVCDAYRKVIFILKDLQHPNEYIQGETLRFLCKLKEPTILTAIIPAIRACLDHKHPYVRRNAILAIFTIYKLIPDAPDIIESMLNKENDPSCQRNAFIMLIHTKNSKAINFLRTRNLSVLEYGDVLQLSIVELIYNYCLQFSDQSFLLKYLYQLSNSNSKAVQFDVANALMSLSESVTVFELCTKIYTNLLVKESDNNVRFVILDRLMSLQKMNINSRSLHNIVPDLLNVLSSGGSESFTDIEVSRKIFELTSHLISNENIDIMVVFFKKELIRINTRFTTISDRKKSNSACMEILNYQKLFINFIKKSIENFENKYSEIVTLLSQSLPECHELVSHQILEILRIIISRSSITKNIVFEQLINLSSNFRNPDIYRSVLWIISSCITCPSEVEKLINILYSQFTRVIQPSNEKVTKSNPISSDGTYLSQSFIPEHSQSIKENIEDINALNNTFIATSLCTILIKLIAFYHKYFEASEISMDREKYNLLLAKSLTIASKLYSSFKYKKCKHTNHRIVSTINMLSKGLPLESLSKFFDISENSTNYYFQNSSQQQEEQPKIKNISSFTDACDDSSWEISFGSIIDACNKFKKQNSIELSLAEAVGLINQFKDKGIDGKIISLTGMSDLIYAEAVVEIDHFDIHFDILVVNQTSDYLQNICIELRTIGSQCILSKSSPLSLPSLKYGSFQVKNSNQISIRVHTGENNIVFGAINYEIIGTNRNFYEVLLDEIELDITDNQNGHDCTMEEFHNMWRDFEWENRIDISSESSDFFKIIRDIEEVSRMIIISPLDENQNDCSYFVTNFYTKNRFGDEAVANVSLERVTENHITGHFRIRATTQKMALSIGHKLTENLKKHH